MGLFAQEENAQMMDAPARMWLTREGGTRKLLLLVVALVVVWWGYGFVRDKQLLSAKWEKLAADEKGLSVVGALDARESYERNMFRIVQSNKSSRAELTDFGWNTIFTNRDGELFSDSIGEMIKYIISVDGQVGYALLEPFLRVGMARVMREPNANALVSLDTKIAVVSKSGSVRHETIGDLIKKYQLRAVGGRIREYADEGGAGGSLSGRKTEQGLTIPGGSLARSCPVVLTGKHFTHADIEEHPASVLRDKTYTLTLFLTPEGRSRFYQWTRDHAQESLVFVINGEVITAGRVAQTLDVNYWEIRNMPDKETAEKLANFINQAVTKERG